MSFAWLNAYGHYFVEGVVTTFWLLVLSWTFGFTLAVLVGLGSVARSALPRLPCRAFSSVIRGTPLLVQIFLLYYGLGGVFAATPAIRHSSLWPFIRSIDAFWYVVLALTLSTGAYVGEVVRGALLAVPRGEIEAARAFGFRGLGLLLRIWLPRALQSMLPTLAGETVLLLKATALASTVTVLDLLGAARLVAAQTFRTYEPLLIAAVAYLLATLVIEAAFRAIEKRIGRAYRAGER